MFNLNKKQFYIIEAIGADDSQRLLLKAALIVKGIYCEVIGYKIEIHEVERNE